MTKEETLENTPTVDTTTKRTDKHTETHTCDYISRQAALDAIEERIKANGYGNVALVSELNRLYGYIRRLPSVQSEHSQNTPQKQPDLETLGVKTGETCADAISRQEVIEIFTQLWDCVGEIADKDEWEDVCKTTANELPSAQRKGKWMFSPDHAEGICTCCNYKIYGRPYQNTYLIVPYNYCPNCGAEMVKGEEDETD